MSKHILHQKTLQRFHAQFIAHCFAACATRQRLLSFQAADLVKQYLNAAVHGETTERTVGKSHAVRGICRSIVKNPTVRHKRNYPCCMYFSPGGNPHGALDQENMFLCSRYADIAYETGTLHPVACFMACSLIRRLTPGSFSFSMVYYERKEGTDW